MKCFFILLSFTLLLGGCSQRNRHELKTATIPPFEPSNRYLMSETALPARIAMLPLYSELEETAALKQLDTVFRQELDKMMLFEVISISREELYQLCGKRHLSPKYAIPDGLFERLHQKYATTGILFTDITHHRVHPPLALGVRAKLYSLEAGALVWAFDTTFDASEPQVQSASKQYMSTLRRVHFPLVFSEAFYQSPSLFGHYVARAVYSTLRKPTQLQQELASN